MDRLALHIEYLLLRHDCVVVPGCGAFINVRHSALEDSETGIMSPMTSEVRFNPALSHDDGMLATSYARRERVSYAEGREMVRTSIANLRDALTFDGEVTIGRLGNLTMDAEQNISFQPMTTARRAAAAIGLTDVRIRPSKVKATTPVEEAAPAEPAPVRRKAFDTERYYYIPVNKMMARMAASFLVVAVVALAALLPFRRDLHEDQASVIPVKAITEAVTKAAAPAPVPTPVAEPVQPEVSADPVWHLIVATFHSQEEADEFIRMNSDRGYDLSTVASRHLYRVSARSTAEKAPLLDEMTSPGFKAAFPQAWIFNSED